VLPYKLILSLISEKPRVPLSPGLFSCLVNVV